jgi:hypothetical protein
MEPPGTLLAKISPARGRTRTSTTPERRRIARESRDAPASDWWNVARRFKDDVVADNAATIAAGAGLFGFLARSRTR